ncbi:PREDICTED: neuroblast differentiation-associated protein AHNAK isoform X1 [Hipposideros armiger]|uniref:Neuroblast differentiation-associated protein AHNAK isoform X1 n=1 Tax=Hipposideros armiger TaxID=186990 RepID=A0A8B7RJ58_HIPAR|nr:PREDICTED: neuroblast differentiation-associated protein AHNAK isoform X1 [Hipposideros armiger]
MEKEEETTRELLLPNWQGSGSHGLTIAQRDDGVFVQEVVQNSPAARTGVVKEGDQIVGATIYFDNLQSGEVTQLLSTMGHHTVGLKLHRKGDRSPEPGQTWTHEVFSSHSSEVVLNTPQPAALEGKDQNKPQEATSQAPAVSVSATNAGGDELEVGWKGRSMEMGKAKTPEVLEPISRVYEAERRKQREKRIVLFGCQTCPGHPKDRPWLSTSFLSTLTTRELNRARCGKTKTDPTGEPLPNLPPPKGL